jgi:hypothetical protein
MQVVTQTISLAELHKMSEKMFNRIVKAVIDIEQEIMVVDAGMHVDEEALLLEEHDAQQENLWGVNLVPQAYGTDGFVIFDSMINVRPRQGNMSRGVDNILLQKRIREIVTKRVAS